MCHGACISIAKRERGNLFGNDKIILTSRKLVRFRCFGINSFQTNNYFVTKAVFHCPPHSSWENYTHNKHLYLYEILNIYTFEKRAPPREISIIAIHNPPTLPHINILFKLKLHPFLLLTPVHSAYHFQQKQPIM